METQNRQSPAPLTVSQKRPLEEDPPIISTPKKADAPSEAGSPLTVLSSVATPSPLKNTSTQSLAAPVSSAPAPTSTPSTTASADTHQPAKRRRFTEKEKEEKRLEREAQDKARAERKAQKEEEKRLKEEEKRKKNDEREEKKRAKELELQQKEEKKRAKELEQQQREEEKRKKERVGHALVIGADSADHSQSQLKLNSFFAKPKAAGSSSGTTVVDAILNSTPALASLAPVVPLQDANSGLVSPQKAIQQRAKNEYERFFLPFELPSHAILAPHNRYLEDPVALASAKSRMDELLSQENVMMDPVDFNSFKSQFPAYQGRGQTTIRVSEVIERLNSSSEQPIDLTKNDAARNPLALLKRIPMKYLHFPEDVRPPYYGTYTKPHTPRQEARLARSPFSRTLPDTNYDYDSEAEWEEPEEGEDLDSDGEEDLDEDGDEDLDGFLDDEEDAQVKRRLISGDMEPVSTGLCWEDTNGVSRLNDGSGAISTEFKDFKIGFLLGTYL